MNVPKQASLIKYGVASTAITMSSKTEIAETPKLTAVIIKLEPANNGCCSLCNRRATLCFCLEDFNSEGDMVLWGEICEHYKEAWEKRSNNEA